ncbi:tripartite motif-containing protein 2-like [Mercenaria mercenaria]|uniref:tripartite motif-containing protein 2-like n=1 Tax=Mercenaria mercenaria TaxID=6596 RepID=UPI00234F9972|nr:tripartite motif-containing protein 2-like [Mercenaria mercenaria]
MAVPGKKETEQFSSSATLIGSDEDLKVYCQPCDRDGPRIPAHGYCTECQEHLCETCFTVHKKHTLSRHHTLLDKNNMPATLQLSSTAVTASQPDRLTKPCPAHKKEVIKFYCHDHKTLLCNVCVTLEHTAKTCKVDYIPNVSGKSIDGKEYKNILKAIDNITGQCHKMSEDVKKVTASSNSSLKNVLANIDKFRKEVNQRLDELERQAKDAVKVKQQENDKKLKTVETTCDDVSTSLKTRSATIKQLNTSKQAGTLFMELKFAEKMIEDYEKTIQQVTAYEVKEYNFKPNEAMSTIVTEKSFGKLTTKTLKHTRPSAVTDIKSRKASHQDDICIKTSKDKNVCLIKGMTFLTPDLLVITDFGNKAIKMVDTNSKSVTDQLQLDTEPYDVTSVTSTDFAVTLPEKQTIQFISVSSKKLKKRHTLKVAENCSGISCHQGKFVVSFINPAKLQILNNNGTILKTIKGENTFSKPMHVTTGSSFIYVSDWAMKTVTRLNWLGEVTGSYRGELVTPQGISLSDDRTVFVCDSEKKVIEEISGECSAGKTVLKEPNCPRTVCWNAKTSALYFSCKSANEKYANFLHVFKLS